MEPIEAGESRLVLLVDHDVDSRRQVRRMLEIRGMEVVQASNGLAALELLQRLPRSFRVVLIELDLPGLPGPVIVETLRLFRPDLQVFCMSASRVTSVPSLRCLTKPLQSTELDEALEESGVWETDGVASLPDEVTVRARERFAVVGDLIEAAMELARAMPGESDRD